jgi:argininosuccinate lyase
VLNSAFSSDIYEHLTVEAVLACHDVPGGTAPERVRKALRDAREKLAVLQEVHGTHA